ncbi:MULTISPECIES: NAD(P)H-dependent oxidoreductase [unclassified Microbacterium]|uniref:NADPH-dependent FMN reductase n=1 Tax=unclassified Microbacterium TaxID=2609290 RepID=UPI00214C7FB8|nr:MULTISPECIES: NAD(P)H-dependent oxidoreductase [unclassified Microbacterium]MCR2783290.1 NAD(P)H-dependent oxidoreductase [Microbacterium sp. zg.B96]MDL5351926.1 NAD(P)H-dependent oxidoreductase [Microbacterium sp. zg-YB36]WIM15835.1 NAD(P)H-dependent oxidoreductase [Microbacterium sp. zg-B96]
MPELLVIIASTRPGRVGGAIGDWAAQGAREHGGFNVTVADLAQLDLPMLDEPNHPRMGQYLRDHTKEWSRLVASADAFLFVTPEYNYGPPASLLNAISYLFWEWAYKPVGFVSYGGIAAGLRGVQVLKQIVTTLRMVPIGDNVCIPFVAPLVKDGVFNPTPIVADTLPFHLDEVLRWTEALLPLQAQVPERRMELPPGAPKPGQIPAPVGV